MGSKRKRKKRVGKSQVRIIEIRTDDGITTGILALAVLVMVIEILIRIFLGAG